MTKKFWLSLVFLATAAVPAMAHHSFTAVFDFSKPVNLHGTVISFEFINPHGWVTMDVKNAEGQTERWRVEVSNPNQLLRYGWKKDIIKPGDEITVDAYRAKDGSNTANGREFTLPGGKKVLGGAPPQTAPGQ